MISKSKILRLCTFQNRLESIIKDFSSSSDVSDVVLCELFSINHSLSDLIDYVRAES